MSKSKTGRKDVEKIFAAVRAGKVRIVKQLIAKGISPNARDPSFFRTSLLMVAAAEGRERIFLELVKLGANLHAVNDLKQSVLESACSRKGTALMVKAIIEDGITPSDRLHSALTNACSEGMLEVVKVLLNSGADVNKKDADFGTPLVCAVAWNQPQIVAVLLKAGARTDTRIPRDVQDGDKHFRKTMLELAIAEGYDKVAKLLMNAGAKSPKPTRRSTLSKKAPTVTRSWKRIDQWLLDNAPKWKPLRNGASSDQIQRAEEKLGFRMSADLRHLYLGHAGSRGDAQIFPSPDGISLYFMSLTEVVKTWKELKKLLKSDDFEGLTPDNHPAIRDEWWNERWVPFAANGGGDYYCVDMTPSKHGKKGQVITHDHESGQHKLLASSIREWLATLANGLEDGTYRFDEEEGLI